jgi:hypothetical protein
MAWVGASARVIHGVEVGVGEGKVPCSNYDAEAGDGKVVCVAGGGCVAVDCGCEGGYVIYGGMETMFKKDAGVEPAFAVG